MNYNIDTQKALTKWGLVLENMGIKDQDKKEWLSEYADYHLMNENLAYSQLGAPAGMGDVVAATVGTTPGALWGTGSGTKGSGDIAQSLLPVSMQIAKQAIGLDLVAVKPASSPRVVVAFLDWKYDDIDTNSGIQRMVFKVATPTAAFKTTINAAVTAAGATLTIGGVDKSVYLSLSTGGNPSTTNGVPVTKTGMVEFLGYSTYTGDAMFHSYRQTNTATTGSAYGFDVALNTFAQTAIIETVFTSGLSFNIGGTTGATGAITVTEVSPVSLIEDHLPGFSRGWSQNSMTRGTAENTYTGINGANLFTKEFQCGAIQESGALQRTEIEDIKSATGIDIVQKMEAQLVNNLTQTISKEIVAKVKALGIQNRSSQTFVASEYDFNVDVYFGYPSGVGTAPGGETTQSAQRKLISKIRQASEYIRIEGRIGGATYIVTNAKMATVIKDIAGYTLSPFESKMNSNGQMYPMGTVDGIQIYVDPYQPANDKRIFLGRKNSVDQPGLLFVPYLMAQSITLIPEATFGLRTVLRSRYSIVDTGFYPEKQFISITVTDTGGYMG